MTNDTVAALFAGKDAQVRATYDRLLQALQPLGPYRAELKKTSIHLVNRSGFAGVHPRKSCLLLNLRTDYAIASDRIVKSEQVSKNRYHNELKLLTPAEVDGELVEWLATAYALG